MQQEKTSNNGQPEDPVEFPAIMTIEQHQKPKTTEEKNQQNQLQQQLASTTTPSGRTHQDSMQVREKRKQRGKIQQEADQISRMNLVNKAARHSSLP